MLGYLFLILTLIALERFRQGKPRFLWFLPLVFLLWVNSHGSLIIGLGTICVYWLAGLKKFELGGIEARQWTAAERTRLELIFLLCLAVLPITPYGMRLAVYPLRYGAIAADERGQHPGVAAHAVQSAGWQDIPGPVAGIFSGANRFRLTCRAEELHFFFSAR